MSMIERVSIQAVQFTQIFSDLTKPLLKIGIPNIPDFFSSRIQYFFYLLGFLFIQQKIGAVLKSEFMQVDYEWTDTVGELYEMTYKGDPAKKHWPIWPLFQYGEWPRLANWEAKLFFHSLYKSSYYNRVGPGPKVTVEMLQLIQARPITITTLVLMKNANMLNHVPDNKIQIMQARESVGQMAFLKKTLSVERREVIGLWFMYYFETKAFQFVELPDNCKVQRYLANRMEELASDSLKLEQVSALGIILYVGFGLAAVAFYLEHLAHFVSRRYNNRDKSCTSRTLDTF